MQLWPFITPSGIEHQAFARLDCCVKIDGCGMARLPTEARMRVADVWCGCSSASVTADSS